ncbi:MAG: hypothetical protein IPK26_10635 [Planctomycetes bacterium]|nr:hypothetical protein [Planctomycetota bacterium]
MIDAQTLVTTGAGASSVILFSPWFQRGGDYATFTAEAVALAGTGAKLTVRAFHKMPRTPAMASTSIRRRRSS